MENRGQGQRNGPGESRSAVALSLRSNNPVLSQKRLDEARQFRGVTGTLDAQQLYARIGLLFLLTLAGAVASWQLSDSNPALGAAFTTVGGLIYISTAIVALVSWFKKHIPAPGVSVLGAVGMGLLAGGISRTFENMWPGIVLQALLATGVVVGVVYALFASGKLRTTPKGRKIAFVLILGYLGFSLINILFTFMGVFPSPFGVRGITVMGIPLGLVIGLFAVALASYFLVMDFENIEVALKQGVDNRLAWWIGFGLIASILWIYVETLRVIAIIRGSQ